MKGLKLMAVALIAALPLLSGVASAKEATSDHYETANIVVDGKTVFRINGQVGMDAPVIVVKPPGDKNAILGILKTLQRFEHLLRLQLWKYSDNIAVNSLF